MPRAYSQTNFWTPERDARLKEMWAEEPRKLIDEMGEEFGLSGSYVSYRATVLNLPRRNPKGTTAAKSDRRDPVKAASTPAPRVVTHIDATPCPYFDPYGPVDEATGKLKRCGVRVDRRKRPDGTKPPAYCKDHEGRVTPISKGPLGAVGGRSGVRYAAGITGWRS